MSKNSKIQEYVNSNPRNLFEKLISTKYCTRQIIRLQYVQEKTDL